MIADEAKKATANVVFLASAKFLRVDNVMLIFVELEPQPHFFAIILSVCLLILEDER